MKNFRLIILIICITITTKVLAGTHNRSGGLLPGIKVFSENEYDHLPGAENIDQLTDSNLKHKYLTKTDKTSIIFITSEVCQITGYTIASGDDAPMRDPAKWTLEGSLDGENYYLIDEQTEVQWNHRNELKKFEVNLKQPGRFYRFKAENSGIDEYGLDYLQISEFELLGNKTKQEI